MEDVIQDDDNEPYSEGFLKRHFQLCEFTDECDHCHEPEGAVWGWYTGYPVCEWDYYCTRCASEALRARDKEERLASEWAEANVQSCLVCTLAEVTSEGLTCPSFGRFEVVTLEVLIQRSKDCGVYHHNPNLSVTEQLMRLRSTGDSYIEVEYD